MHHCSLISCLISCLFRVSGWRHASIPPFRYSAIPLFCYSAIPPFRCFSRPYIGVMHGCLNTSIHGIHYCITSMQILTNHRRWLSPLQMECASDMLSRQNYNVIIIAIKDTIQLRFWLVINILLLARDYFSIGSTCTTAGFSFTSFNSVSADRCGCTGFCPIS